MDVNQLHNYYKDKDYDWLPTKEIPKKMGQEVPQEHLETLEVTKKFFLSLKSDVLIMKITVETNSVNHLQSAPENRCWSGTNCLG